jgi:hypothetical protein
MIVLKVLDVQMNLFFEKKRQLVVYKIFLPVKIKLNKFWKVLLIFADTQKSGWSHVEVNNLGGPMKYGRSD